jgi:methyl-accepting chemotaxis protein
MTGRQQYAEAFAQIRALDAEFNATMATILAAAEEAGDRLDAAAAITGSTDLQVAYAAIMRDFLLARNSTSKFVFADDLDALAEAHYRLTAVHDALQAIAARPGAALAKPAEAALGPIQVYIDSVDEFQRIGVERNRINQTVLNVLGPEAQAALGDLQDTLFARQDTLGPTTAAEIKATKIAAEIVSIIAILVGLALAYVIGRWIAGAVRGMADTMSQMAEGDFEAEVTGAEHKHELGAMARALQVFAENGREKARLDAEAAKAAERERAERAEAEKLTNAIREAVRRAVDGDFGGRVASTMPTRSRSSWRAASTG